MSKESLNKFFKVIEGNAAAQAKVKEFKGNAEALAAYAKEQGYDVTSQEIKEYQTKILDFLKARLEKLGETKHDRPGVEALRKFLILSETDPKVAERIEAADSQGIIAIGKELGYNFDKEDLKVLADAITEQPEELSDAELELVAGGIILTTLIAAIIPALVATGRTIYDIATKK